MKTLLIAILFLVACSKEDVKPTYTSIEGNWKFSSIEVSGQFTITKYLGVLSTDNSGSATINGAQFAITKKKDVEGVPPNLMTIYLTGDASGVTLRDLEVNKFFDVMTIKNYDYYTPTSSAVRRTGIFTITR